MSDCISRQAVEEILDKNQLPYHIYPYVWDEINALPPAQPDVPDINVGDMISRQAAIDALLKCGDYYKGNDEAKRGVSQCVGVIYDLPSAQPKIIRCKDCKWYREGVHLSPNKFCYRLKDNSGERIGYNFADNDFCSRAERRTDGRHD